jgi:signal transduction histidine kinase
VPVRTTVGGMDDGGLVAGDGDPDLPLVYRLARYHYSPGQLVLMDVAAVVILSAFCAFVLPRMATVSGAAWETAGWAAYAVTSVAILFRRRFPWPVLALTFVVATISASVRAAQPAGFYLVMVVYSLVVVSSRRTALIVASVVSAGLIAAVIAGGGGSSRVVPAVIGSVALIGLGWLAGENARATRVYAERYQERAVERAATVEAERVEQVRRAVSDERVEIARELHDIVAHAMSVIAVRSGVARMVLDSQPEQAREALTIIETTTRQSLQEMRLLVGILRDSDDHHPELGPAPGLCDLDRLVAAMKVAGVAVTMDVEGAVRNLPPAADLSAYRIVQEALTNVVHHAGPTRARVRIAYRPDEVGIEVADDGPQGPRLPPSIPRVGSGHGLVGMRERAALFGGELDAGPCANGFRITATLRTNGLHDRDRAQP